MGGRCTRVDPASLAGATQGRMRRPDLLLIEKIGLFLKKLQSG